MKKISDCTILVVEDEVLLRDAIVYALEKTGFKVLFADNGVIALDIVKANHIDLILSDIRMPGGDGITLLDTVHAINPDIPIVILMTGQSDSTESECLKKGAKKVLYKPFNRKVVISAITEALGIVE